MKTTFNQAILAYCDDMGVVKDSGVGTTEHGKTGVKINGALFDVYAAEILRDSIPHLRFYQFAEVLVELGGANAGDTIKIQRLQSIGIGKKLTEKEKIKSKSLNTTFESITVHEWGDAVGLSGRATYTSQIDLMEGAKLSLLDSYVLTLDIDLRDTALSGTNIVYGYTKDGERAETRAGMDETSEFSWDLVEDINTILATNRAPKFGGTNGYYVAIVHPHIIRSLRKDARWIDVQNYHTSELPYYGKLCLVA